MQVTRSDKDVGLTPDATKSHLPNQRGLMEKGGQTEIEAIGMRFSSRNWGRSKHATSKGGKAIALMGPSKRGCLLESAYR